MPDSLGRYRDYLQLMGHHVTQTRSSLWIDIRPRIYQSSPCFALPSIQPEEALQVLAGSGALACRWFSPDGDATCLSSDGQGVLVYVASAPYDLSTLHQKARNQTRRGLERLSVGRCSYDSVMVQRAYPVYAENIKRLGIMRSDRQIERRWATWANALTRATCAELWCAWSDDLLAGFCVAVWSPWGVEIAMLRSSDAGRQMYPSNALVYTLTRDALERGAPTVSFGLSSFSGGGDGLHHFKTNMGYRAIALREHYQWHPLIRPLLGGLDAARVRRAYRLLARVARLGARS